MAGLYKHYQQMRTLFILLINAFLFCNSQKPSSDLSGVYMSEDHLDHIEIQDSCFYFRSYSLSGESELFTYCRCAINIINSELLEIKSFPSDFDISSSFQLDYGDATNPDSLNLQILVPANQDLDVFLSCDYDLGLGHTYQSFQIINGVGQISLPRSKVGKEWTISINPRYPFFLLPDEVSRGLAVTAFKLDEIDIQRDVFICIPAINNDYFLRFFIKSEFVRVQNDTLFWHGEKYVKVSLKDLSKIEKRKKVKGVCSMGMR